MKTSDFFSFFSALSKFISDSDGRIVSKKGLETLQDPDKMKKVNAAIKHYHSNPDEQIYSNGIVVDL